MPLYQYKCANCDTHYSIVLPVEDRDLPVRKGICTAHCNTTTLKRVYSFSTHVFQPRFDQSLGQEITSPRAEREAFKVLSAQATERTGYETNYQPVDLNDREALGVTERGVEMADQASLASGARDRKLIL